MEIMAESWNKFSSKSTEAHLKTEQLMKCLSQECCIRTRWYTKSHYAKSPCAQMHFMPNPAKIKIAPKCWLPIQQMKSGTVCAGHFLRAWDKTHAVRLWRKKNTQGQCAEGKGRLKFSCSKEIIAYQNYSLCETTNTKQRKQMQIK